MNYLEFRAKKYVWVIDIGSTQIKLTKDLLKMTVEFYKYVLIQI